MSWLATFGESMGLCLSRSSGQLRAGSQLQLSFGGAESNVAIGLRRLAVTVDWFGRVGEDRIGQMIVGALRGEGVDVSAATVDAQRPTGLMMRWSVRSNRTTVLYYRQQSAAAAITPEDLDMSRIAAASVLLVTGITPALSLSARRAVFAAVEVARSARTIVCLDVNFRSSIWSASDARPVLRDLVRHSDIVLVGERERHLLSDEVTLANVAKDVAALGPGTVIIKRGPEGTVAVLDDVLSETKGRPVVVVDPVGAGDGFAAGFLSALHDGMIGVDAIERGLVVAAAVVRTEGDWEGLPDKRELADEATTDWKLPAIER